MRLLIAMVAAAGVLVGCSTGSSTGGAEDVSSATSKTSLPTHVSEVDEDEFGDQTAMREKEAGEGGSVGCTTREECDVDFGVESVLPIACDAYGLTADTQVVRVEIEAEARQDVAYPGALDVFNRGSWSALTDDGYTVRSLDLAAGCAGQDSSLLMYGLNPGEKVRNRVDFLVPRDVVKIQLQPADLEGGGWNWPVTGQQ